MAGMDQQLIVWGRAVTENPEQVVLPDFVTPAAGAEGVADRRAAIEPEDVLAREAAALLASPAVDAKAIGFVRRLLDNRQRQMATSFSHSLMRAPATRAVGQLCTAIVALSTDYTDHAWQLLTLVDCDEAIRRVPAEYLGLWLERDGAAAEAHIRSLAAAEPSPLAAPVLWSVARRAAALKRYDLLVDLIARIALLPDLGDLSAAERAGFDWTRDYLKNHPLREQIAGVRRPPLPGDQGRINIGVLDYKTLDRHRSTSNIGDYVQTLAFLSNLARFQSVHYDDSDLGRKIDAFKERIVPDRRIRKMAGKARAVAVNRDFSNWDDIPEQTWTFAYGWYMHPVFESLFDFPFHPNVRPIFISFHVNRAGMLSERAIDYLRTYQPIGCRDWSTVYLLREKGVEAFFSGCVTSTVGQMFSEPQTEVAGDRIALVDYAARESEFDGLEAVPFTQEVDDVRELALVDALDSAIGLLEGYRHYGKIATSRLHCYLPCTSLGLDVTFKPKRRSDVRFEGLMNLNERRFEKMRSGIEDKLQTMLRAILSGDSEENIYAKWRRVCAADVAYADSYCATFPPLPEPSFDIAATVEGLRAGAYALNAPPVVDDPVRVAFALDGNLREMLPVTIESAVTRLSRPAVFSMLARGIKRSYFEELARDFPQIHFQVFNFDGVDYGEELNLLKHTTASTIDRLLLADLLADVDKIIYLDIDIVIQGDLARLYDVDLQGRPLAGKATIPLTWRTGHDLVHRASARLKAARSWVLRRRLAAEGRLDFRCFNAGVTLMNLQRMRADNAARLTVPLVENFGMNDQDALNMYARSDRVEFDGIWNANPSQEMTGDDGILHFAGTEKPWGPNYIFRAEDYAAARERYAARRKARLGGTPVAN